MCDWTRAGSFATAVGVLVLVAFCTVFIWAWTSLGNFLFLLFLAWLFGLAIDPIVTRLHTRFGMKRCLGTMLVFLALGLVTAIFFIAFGQLFATQIVALVQAAPDIVKNVIDFLNERFNLGLNQATILDQLNLGTQDVANIASQAAGGVLGVLSSAIGVVSRCSRCCCFAFYFAADGPRLRRTIASVLPNKSQAVFNDIRGPSPPTRPGLRDLPIGSRGRLGVLLAIFFIIIQVAVLVCRWRCGWV